MRLAELPEDTYQQRLAETGILLRTGPFIVHLKSAIGDFANLLHRFYADFPLVPEPAIADFHLRLETPRSLRSRWRPQALFLLDGESVFLPYPLSHAFPLFEFFLQMKKRYCNYRIWQPAFQY